MNINAFKPYFFEFIKKFDKKWDFTPTVKKGDKLEPGSIIGTVPETPLIEHKILLPPDCISGTVVEINKSGKYTTKENVVTLEKDGKKTSFSFFYRYLTKKHWLWGKVTRIY